MQRVGFLINPVAGMGGAVGLHGTDGALAAAARLRGAASLSPSRALAALKVLAEGRSRIELLTPSGDMGEVAARNAGFEPAVVYSAPTESTSIDTANAVRVLAAEGVALIVFAGGDGTARDIHAVIGSAIPVLGIPAGVKMHSAVFATSPPAAGRLALGYVDEPNPSNLVAAEIMDRGTVDASASPRLYGYARAPRLPRLLQRAKATGGGSDDDDLAAACLEAARAAGEDERLAVIGPGTTMRAVKRCFGVDGTLLGVDVFRGGLLVQADAAESDLLRLLAAEPARIVVGVVGGQGFLFGRGNQQISAAVIRSTGRENIVAVASQAKLAALVDRCLYVDTGDRVLDTELTGFTAVLTGPGRRTMMRVLAA